ncbi:hypothetical protein [Microvirga aerophila]|uniref:Uncharacterized protein n=1 Tax=Microvirga aerophila TaxID=670291 RepID=A0A512C540_9HYPH|nr:hypothetical protein [Microvirga aerophila]GEO19167.1 hypothetical protein MAE02_68630 [Microvirga aerophila]
MSVVPTENIRFLHALTRSLVVFATECRYFAYSSFAPNLVPGDTNNIEDVFVFDRKRSTTELVSVATNGDQGSDFSVPSGMSANGLGRVKTLTCRSLEQFHVLRGRANRRFLGA